MSRINDTEIRIMMPSATVARMRDEIDRGPGDEDYRQEFDEFVCGCLREHQGNRTLEVKESVYRAARLLEAVFASAISEADWRITESQLRADDEGIRFWSEVWRFLMTEEIESGNFDLQIVPDEDGARA